MQGRTQSFTNTEVPNACWVVRGKPPWEQSYFL